jgi:hypothetical protein
VGCCTPSAGAPQLSESSQRPEDGPPLLPDGAAGVAWACPVPAAASVSLSTREQPATRGVAGCAVSGWRQCAASYASRTAWLMRPREETSWPFAFAHSRIFASSSEFPRFGALPAVARPDRPVTLRAAAT